MLRVFSSLNDPLLMSRITRSGPGIQKRKQFQRRIAMEEKIYANPSQSYLDERLGSGRGDPFNGLDVYCLGNHCRKN